MNDELALLRKVEAAARCLREPCGYDSGATSSDLDEALKALDDLRARPRPVCVGYLAHEAYTYCPVCDERPGCRFCGARP